MKAIFVLMGWMAPFRHQRAKMVIIETYLVYWGV
jgi:hypothetical protein